MAERASRTIGDACIVASELPGERGAALIGAGKAAFIQTHAVLLTTAAAVIAALAIVVFFTLAGYRDLPVRIIDRLLKSIGHADY